MKIAFRMLLKNKRFTLINLTGLTIGLTGFIVIMSWVKGEFSFDRFHSKKHRTVQLTIKHPSGILDPNVPFALPPRLASQYPEIESFSPLNRLKTIMNCSFIFQPDSSDPIRAYEPEVVRVAPAFFNMFDFPVIYGNENKLYTGPGEVVISSRIANTYYSGLNPVGHTLIMNNNQPLTITGVIDVPVNSFFQFDFFLPVLDDMSNDWNWRDPSYLLLKPGVDQVAFVNKIASSLNDNYPQPLPDIFHVGILPIHKTHLAFEGKTKAFVFGCVAILLLVVAALNYLNLTSSNYSKRIRESGIRKVMGADRYHLILEFLLESFILAIFSMLLALVLAELVLPLLTQLFGRRIEIGYLDQPLILLLLLLIVGIVTSLASLYPALLFTKGSPVYVLHGKFNPGSKRSVIILLTVIFQFTISITLMISTLVVLKQVKYAQGKDLGFSIDNTISIPMNRGLGNNFESLLGRLESRADILMATAGQSYPYQEDYKTNIYWINQGEQIEGNFRFSICLNNYQKLFGMQLAEGRFFEDQFGADNNNFVINETAANFLGFETPVGQSLTMWGRTGEIVGVVKDFHHVSLHREIMPHIFSIHPSNYRGLKFLFIKLSPESTAETLSYIEEVCKDLAPDYPYTYSFLNAHIRELYTTDQNLTKILGLFVFLTLTIAGLGIYGLAYYSAEKKTREITIRKVFGARILDNLVLLYRTLAGRIGISLLVAVVLSYYLMDRWLQNFAYRIDLDIMLFIAPAFLAILTAVAATTIAMWGSLRQNPADKLKQE